MATYLGTAEPRTHMELVCGVILCDGSLFIDT